MQTSNWIALAALAFGVINTCWLIVRHLQENRVRILWNVSVGSSVENPTGYVRITLFNRGRLVLLDRVTIYRNGPPLEEASEEQLRDEAKQLDQWLRDKNVKRPSGHRIDARFGERDAIELKRNDCHKTVIPSALAGSQTWPRHRSGISVGLRDGRSRDISWAEIYRQRGWWHRLDPRRALDWIDRF